MLAHWRRISARCIKLLAGCGQRNNLGENKNYDEKCGEVHVGLLGVPDHLHSAYLRGALLVMALQPNSTYRTGFSSFKPPVRVLPPEVRHTQSFVPTDLTGNHRLGLFSGTHAPFRYRYTTNSNCNAASGTSATTSFSVNANVAANCLVAIQNIDFGTKGVLNANVDATGSVTATCTPGTTYTISLNGGTTNSAPMARKMSRGAETVTYALYKDVARSQPWGDAATPGSTVAGTGNGAAQVLTVYGRVPPQDTPNPGTYTDTVVADQTSDGIPGRSKRRSTGNLDQALER
ncbi:spore coat protein U-like protein [Rhizobium mongolense]